MDDKKMTLADVKAKIKEIKKESHDNEVAHSLEDDLHYDILKSLALYDYTNDEVKQLCYEGIKTHKIKFTRWSA